MPTRVEVCPASELPAGERTIVEVDGLPHSVGVFNVDGEFFALANVCPHHLAPLCEGTVTGEMRSDGVGDFQPVREGEVIQCPWHGWKFDIRDGTSVSNPHTPQTRTYDATVEPSRADQPDQSDQSDEADEVEEYGTALQGEEPPVDSYDVDVESDVVVLYV
jgi:nitrite reductase/ring-hydroxylating ferredoxin subunit